MDRWPGESEGVTHEDWWGGGGGVPGTPGATGAGSVTRLQRGMPGMEQAAFPQEEETGQVPIE